MDSTTERLLRKAGISADLWNMGAASVAYTEGCHGVARAELERLIALVRADERERLKDVMLKSAKHAEKNGIAIGAYAGQEEEGRARVLAACHLLSLAQLLESQQMLEKVKGWSSELAAIRSGGE